MASRFSKKPDPSIKKNVLQARAALRKTKNAHTSVVITSIAATLFSWILFSNQDAVALEAARTANINQAAIVMSVPTQSSLTKQIDVTPVPLVLGITR